MRVIAGTARGTRLVSLPGEEVTRPTLERVKEAMFSSLHFTLPGARVLDLFAGSGQLGVEALSREAAQCTFVDENREAVRVIARNCEAANVQQRARVVQRSAQAFLQDAEESYHVVLLDPPFRQGTLAAILPAVARVTAPGGTVLCESETGLELPESCEGLHRLKQHRYGTVLVTRYEKEQEELQA